MRVIWTPAARQDREDVYDYLASEGHSAAERMDARFSDAAASLETLAHRGRPGVVPGTRELLPHASYRLIYEVRDDVVWLLALVHTSRRWPPVT